MSRPTPAAFDDAPEVNLDDPAAHVEVDTNAPTRIVTETRYARATDIQVTGRIAPGQQVTLRAVAGEAWTTRKTVSERVVQGRTKRSTAYTRLNYRAATPAELRQLRWRAHSGGEILVDQRPGAASDSVVLALPPSPAGETLVVWGYNEEPRVDFHKSWPV